MKREGSCISALVASLAIFAALQARGAIISGTITNWPESGPVLTIGDGVNHVSIWWSINTFNRGWFYGSAFTGDSNVAHAAGTTDVSQIADASVYTFTNGSIGPFCDADCDPDSVGEFIVWRNTGTGHYGVLRIDDIHTTGGVLDSELDGTWWFQTDGTGDFAACPWDCGDNGGDVDVVDFLALLAGWGLPGPCDFDGGGVSVTDFLKLLAQWGPCP